MATKLSEAEKRTLGIWLDTDTGDTLLKIIDEMKQNYLDEAMAGLNQGAQFTHDRVVAARTTETIYYWLKGFQKPQDKPDDDD